MPEVRGTIKVKKNDGTAININDVWYGDYRGANLKEVVRGDEVTVEYVEKGNFKNIKKVTKHEKVAQTPPEATEQGKTGAPSGNSEYVTGVRIGCAFRVAGEAASGRMFVNENGEEDPEKAAQWIIGVADRVLAAMNARN